MTNLNKHIKIGDKYYLTKDIQRIFAGCLAKAIDEKDVIYVEDLNEDIYSMPKLELDMFAEKQGIILDRRKTREDMIKQYLKLQKEKGEKNV